MSQAAFSRRIIALENWIGVSLVDRTQKPVKLTNAGHLFLAETTQTLLDLSSIKMTITNPAYIKISNVKLAMPHVLSISRFSTWWPVWSENIRTSASISVGNVSAMIAEFMTGTTDILICHNSKSLPLLLDPKLYLSHEIEKDRLSPYAPIEVANNIVARFPGTLNEPLPLLHYSKGAYFARLVDLIIKRSPNKLHSNTQVEADMSGVIRDCVAQGLGIGWLPESCVGMNYEKKIQPLKVTGWSDDLTINAYMHTNTTNPTALLLWDRISSHRR